MWNEVVVDGVWCGGGLWGGVCVIVGVIVGVIVDVIVGVIVDVIVDVFVGVEPCCWPQPCTPTQSRQSTGVSSPLKKKSKLTF